MTDAKTIAEKLLEVNAVKLNPRYPFTWASGWKSPIYCDNRKALSYPKIRNVIKSRLCQIISENFSAGEVIAGVATAGIPWGAMAADQLSLPYIYVRPKPKEHGLGNQVEGAFVKGQQVVVVEDLVSTGKSSLQVVDVLRNLGMNVVGMVSIFNYGFPVAAESIKQYNVPYFTLTDYGTLIGLAVEKGVINKEDEGILLKWQEDPANWKGVL